MKNFKPFFKEYMMQENYKIRMTQGIELFAKINTKDNIGFETSYLEILTQDEVKETRTPEEIKKPLLEKLNKREGEFDESV